MFYKLSIILGAVLLDSSEHGAYIPAQGTEGEGIIAVEKESLGKPKAEMFSLNWVLV